jgi:two-component system response regulator AtoC
VANSRTTVLLQGETGTGKEFMARVLHYNVTRAQGPFIAVNCTAIPHDLFESELFGHERGAFTGATHRKSGLLEQAHQGTLFLDEIGDLDLAMQAKLLRVVQERSFRRLGGDQDCSADFQLIAATNRSLKREVMQGRFREDLFFRLNVIRLELPPLRHRVEDIAPLSFRALMKYSREFGKEAVEIDPPARRALERYVYPGNIRELENIIERAVIFCHGPTITLDVLPNDLHHVANGVTVGMTTGDAKMMRIQIPFDELSLANIEHAVIEERMRSLRDNKTLATKQLGITRFAPSRKLKMDGPAPLRNELW